MWCLAKEPFRAEHIRIWIRQFVVEKRPVRPFDGDPKASDEHVLRTYSIMQ